MKCPNKNLEEWKLLVSELGEDEAYKVYIANGEEIPSLAIAQVLIEMQKRGTEESVVSIEEQLEANRKKEIADFVINIFPDTKVKKVVYHGSKEKFDDFLEDNLNYFHKLRGAAIGYGNNIYTTVVDIRRPFYEDTGNLQTKNYNVLFDQLEQYNKDGYISNEGNIVVVTQPEQVHILTEQELKQIDEINAKYDKQLSNLQDNKQDQSKNTQLHKGNVEYNAAQLQAKSKSTIERQGYESAQYKIDYLNEFLDYSAENIDGENVKQYCKNR